MSGKDISLAVLGAGNIGCALAGHMTLKGFDVSLAELPKFKANLDAPKKMGGLEVTGEAEVGFARINKITTDIPDAIQGKDLIFITSIAFGHEPFTRLCAPYLEDGQSLIYISYFSSLRMAKLLNDLEVDKEITIAETLSAMYASVRLGKKGAFFANLYRDDSKVEIKRWKDGLPIAAFPATRTKKIVDKVRKIYPSITATSNVLESSIFNGNVIYHPPGVILNAGWIEHTKGGFIFNIGANTPAIQNVRKTMEQEKVSLAESFGFNSKKMKDRIEKFYAKWFSDPEKSHLHQEKYYKNNDAPTNLNHRFLTEDIAYGLVPMSYLANVTGVEMPTIKSIIHLANLINKTNYWEEGITLKKMGLDGMNKEQILEYVNTGSR